MIYTENETILKVENLSLVYDRPILSNINFEIKNIVRPEINQGQIISLIGRSGVGKTQVFKLLAGLQKPTTGSIKIGTDLHDVKIGEVGIVPQNYLLFDHRTIKSNLEIAINNEKKDDIIKYYADKFDLTQTLTKYPQQLSGGQRQRVSIIQQILTGNNFILLDEPFSGLDCIIKEKIIQLLVDISLLNDLTTLIIVSHDISSSLAISDRALILANKDNLGAKIVENINLAALDLAWNKDIKFNKNFIDLVQHIESII